MKSLTEVSAQSLLEFMDYHCLYLLRTGYRGRDGWQVMTPDPGGHYQEEAQRSMGYGQTAVEAVNMALERLAERGYAPSPKAAQEQKQAEPSVSGKSLSQLLAESQEREAQLREELKQAKETLRVVQGNRDADAENYRSYTSKNEALKEQLAASESQLKQAREALGNAEAFIGVMFGDSEGEVPEKVTTPIGIPVKVGSIMTDIRAALSPATPKEP